MPGDGDFNEIFADDDLDDLWQRPAVGGCVVLERRPQVRQKSIPRHAPRPIPAPVRWSREPDIPNVRKNPTVRERQESSDSTLKKRVD